MRLPAAHRGAALLLVVPVVLAGCSGTDPEAGGRRQPEQPATPSAGSGRPTPSGTPRARPPTPAPTPSRSIQPEQQQDSPASGRRDADPVIERIPDRQWRRIVTTGVWRPECPVGRRDLRRVRVDYVSFEGEVRRGTLVVNRDVARSIARIFTRLFEERFPIRRMQPVEVYGGDVNVSLAADNTSAYNCRRLSQINAPVLKSPHANGRAVDINPRENPWVDLRCDCWLPSPAERRRAPGRGKIVRGGLVWRVFRQEGWIWQNIDVPDYMHFDTGYPSRPYRGPEANKRWHERQQRRERARS